MPRIPEIARPGLSLEVPAASANLGAAGAIGEGVSRLGAAVEGIGFDLAEKIKRAEAQTAVNSNILDDRIASKNYMEELKLKHPTGYVTEDGVIKKNEKGNPISVSEAYMSWANKRYHEKQAAMPSDMAQKAYQEHAANLFSEDYVRVQGDERLLKLDAFKRQGASDLAKIRSEQLERPDIGSAWAGINDRKASIMANVGVLYNENTAKSMIDEENDQIAFSYIDGSLNYAMAQKKLVGGRSAAAKKVLNILLGKDENSFIADQLTPENRSMLTKRAIEASKTAISLDEGEARAGFRNRIAALKRGSSNPKRIISDAVGFVANIAIDSDTGKIKPEIATELHTEIATAVAEGLDASDPAYYFADKATRQKIIDSSDNNYREISKHMKLVGAGELPIAESNKARTARNEELSRVQQSDPVRYILNSPYANSGSFKEISAVDSAIRSGNIYGALSNLPAGTGETSVRVAKLYSAKAGLGPGEGRIISKEASAAIGTLKDSKDVEKANSDIIALQKTFGPYYSEVIRQAIRDKNLPESWMFAALFYKDPMENKRIVKTLLSGSNAWNLLDQTSTKKISQKQKDQVDGVFEEELKPIVSSMLLGNVSSVVNDDMALFVVNSLKTKAIERINMGASAEEAAKSSIDWYKQKFIRVPVAQDTQMYIGRQYITPVGENASISDDDASGISSFLTRFKTSMKPEDYRALNPNVAGFDRQLRRAQWVYTQNDGEWGVALMMPGNLAGTEHVEELMVLKKDKTKLFFPIHQLPALGAKARTELKKTATWTPFGGVQY